MNILVTGGAGFIGSHLCRALKASGHGVRIVDIRAENEADGLYDYRAVNILDRNNLTLVAQGMDLVIHLAAKHRFFGVSEEEFFRANEEGTKCVLAAMDKARVKRLIFYSSVAVYGDSKGPTHEETEPKPVNPYGLSKLAAENWVRKWANEDSGRSAIVVRPTVVFGPHNKGNIYRLIRQIYYRAYLPVGEGDNVKSIAYVENLVAATMFLMNRDAKGVEVFNYSDTPHLIYREIVNLIYSGLGRKAPGYHVPVAPMLKIAGPVDHVMGRVGVNFSIKTALLKMNRTTHHSADKIMGIGFMPEYSSVDGLKRMVDWYLNDLKRGRQEKRDG